MRRNPHQPPNGDAIQGAFPFESGEYPLHRMPLFVDGLPFGILLGFVFEGQFLAVHWVNVDDGNRPKLPLEELVGRSTR